MRKANAAAVRLSTCPAKLVSWERSSCTAISKECTPKMFLGKEVGNCVMLKEALTFRDIWYKGAALSCNPCSQELGTCSGLSGGYCHEALHREQPRDFA